MTTLQSESTASSRFDITNQSGNYWVALEQTTQRVGGTDAFGDGSLVNAIEAQHDLAIIYLTIGTIAFV